MSWIRNTAFFQTKYFLFSGSSTPFVVSFQTIAQKIIERELQLIFFCNNVPKSIVVDPEPVKVTQDPDQHQGDADPQQWTWQKKEIFGMEKRRKSCKNDISFTLYSLIVLYF
jgi:hypothetical protein